MGSYLFQFFWIKRYCQYLLWCTLSISTHYLLRYYKEQTQLVGLFFKKGVLEFVVFKIIDKYTNKEFLKSLFWNWMFHRYFSTVLITTIAKIVWHMKLTEYFFPKQLSQSAQKCLLKIFLWNLILMTRVSFCLFSLLELIWNCIIFL